MLPGLSAATGTKNWRTLALPVFSARINKLSKEDLKKISDAVRASKVAGPRVYPALEVPSLASLLAWGPLLVGPIQFTCLLRWTLSWAIWTFYTVADYIQIFKFFEKGLDPIYLIHPGYYRKHPGEVWNYKNCTAHKLQECKITRRTQRKIKFNTAVLRSSVKAPGRRATSGSAGVGEEALESGHELNQAVQRDLQHFVAATRFSSGVHRPSSPDSWPSSGPATSKKSTTSKRRL